MLTRAFHDRASSVHAGGARAHDRRRYKVEALTIEHLYLPTTYQCALINEAQEIATIIIIVICNLKPHPISSSRERVDVAQCVWSGIGGKGRVLAMMTTSSMRLCARSNENVVELPQLTTNNPIW